VGVGGYLMLSHSIYVDVAGYHTLDTSFQKAMGIGVQDETQIPGIAPYWRVAYTKAVGNQTFEVGLSGLHADTYPNRDNSAGEDHIDDLGADAQYQTSFGKSDVTALFTVYREGQHWRASHQLGNTTNRFDHLWSTKVAVDYLYGKTYGAAAGYFVLDGSHDPLLYPDTPNGSPLSDGVVFQINYLPFNKAGGPSFWPRSNVKLSVQYDRSAGLGDFHFRHRPGDDATDARDLNLKRRNGSRLPEDRQKSPRHSSRIRHNRKVGPNRQEHAQRRSGAELLIQSFGFENCQGHAHQSRYFSRLHRRANASRRRAAETRAFGLAEKGRFSHCSTHYSTTSCFRAGDARLMA
jgi:hypothetical protein